MSDQPPGIDGEIMTNNYQLICGMEVHVELKTASKMFCGCKNDPFHAPEPNCYTCPVCLGMPGALPVANKKAIEWTIKLGLALNCKINLFSKFDRKHYFYPDLPKGYQISQYDLPFCYDGWIETSQGKIKITRIHLEEDTGKLLHKTVDGKKVSLIDFNRSSVPLVEIVTEPDIHSAAQAKEYAKKLRDLIRYIDIADCDMEQGGMRLEANTSLQSIEVAKNDPTKLPNYKVELKNINSFKFLEQAIGYEMDRQAKILDLGKTPTQETRGWNAAKAESYIQRSKESAEDYRYFPDPDLPPLHFTEADIERIKTELPELPAAKIDRWQREFGIEPRFAELLLVQTEHKEFWDDLFSAATTKKLSCNQLASAIVNKKIKLSTEVASMLTDFANSQTVDTVDTAELQRIIQKIITDHPAEVAAYQSGKTALINFFVGQVMRELGKKVKMQQVMELLKSELDK